MSPAHLWSSCGCLSLIALLAGCSNDDVNLGGGRPSHTVQPGERCSGSSIVQGPVTVHDQNELAELAGCEQIDGDLHIEVFSGADLTPLSSLRVVDGSLEIGAYPDIVDDPRTDLMDLKGKVDRIVRNGYLSSLTGLEGLERVSTLQITSTAAEDLEPLLGLRQLSGRENGQLPAGSAYVESNANLRDLHGLSNVESVRELVLADNPALTSLGGMQLSERAGNINLVDCPLLSSIDELAVVGSASTLSLSHLGITDVDSLVKLGMVENGVNVDGNALLQNLDGFANLYGAGSFTVANHPLLQSIPSLRGLVFVVDAIMVFNNPELQSLHLDLPNEPSGGNTLRGSPVPDPIKLINIGQNASLTEISLGAGMELGRVIAIYDNPALARVSIGTVRSMDKLDITGNENLQQVDMGALQTVDELLVTNNPKLDDAQFETVRTFTATVGRNAASP